MNYALTLNGTIITGVHEGTKSFTAETFARNPRLAGQEVRIIHDRGEYQTGVDIRCYETDGTMKPLVWCIQQGYLPLPQGKEIIDGVLVDTAVPEAEAPPSLLKKLEDAQAAVIATDAVMADLLLLLIESGVIASV